MQAWTSSSEISTRDYSIIIAFSSSSSSFSFFLSFFEENNIFLRKNRR